MKIYHYTSLDTLALILKNRTIKFNRLDRVDDVEEGTIESNGVYLGRNVFVSCWTENAEESIPMWNMYARGSAGVRIGLEKDMFCDYLIKDIQLPNGQKTQGYIYCKLPSEDFTNDNYWILPITDINNEMFYRHVEYVNDVMEKTGKIVSLTKNEDGTSQTGISLKEIGKYKHKRWEFQHESRFALTAFAKNPFLLDPDKVGDIMINTIMQNQPLPIDRYFMHLKDDVVENIEIIISPEANEGHRLIVEALCNLYLKNNKYKIQQSELGDRVKFK